MSRKLNCVVMTDAETFGDEDSGNVYWTGSAWSMKKSRAKLMSIADAENHVERMRKNDVWAWWERMDKSRSAL